MSVASETGTPVVVAGGSRRPEIVVSLGVACAGMVVALCGAVAFLLRVKLAAVFLGARFLFEIPITDADASKVLFIALSSIGVVLYGMFTFAVAAGLALFAWRQR